MWISWPPCTPGLGASRFVWRAPPWYLPPPPFLLPWGGGMFPHITRRLICGPGSPRLGCRFLHGQRSASQQGSLKRSCLRSDYAQLLPRTPYISRRFVGWGASSDASIASPNPRSWYSSLPGRFPSQTWPGPSRGETPLLLPLRTIEGIYSLAPDSSDLMRLTTALRSGSAVMYASSTTASSELEADEEVEERGRAFLFLPPSND